MVGIILLAFAAVSVSGNIWDNLLSNMKAPHVYFPNSFDATFSTDSIINITAYLAVDGKANRIHSTGWLNAMDFKPREFYDVIINFRSKKVSI